MTKGEQTRQRILEAAASLFNERGFAGCSMHDVMEAAGLEKGGIYRHFTNKEQLAVEALRFALAGAVKLRTEDLGEELSPLERLQQTVRRFRQAPSTIRGGCPLMNTAIDADDGNPALRKLARQAMQAWKARLTAVVEEGIAKGEIRPEVEPGSIANTLIATLEGALMISRLERTPKAMQDAETVLDLFLQGIRSKPSSQERIHSLV